MDAGWVAQSFRRHPHNPEAGNEREMGSLTARNLRVQSQGAGRAVRGRGRGEPGLCVAQQLLPASCSVAKCLGAKTVAARALACTQELEILSEVVEDREAVNAVQRFLGE